MNDQGPGLPDAIRALARTRDRLGAADIVATWNTAHGPVQIIVDADGHHVFHDGQSVGGRAA